MTVPKIPLKDPVMFSEDELDVSENHSAASVKCKTSQVA